jgi:hypothetical protein
MSPRLLPSSNGDAYDATNNPYGFLTYNPFFVGTGGSMGTGGSGSLGANWAANHNGTRAGLTTVYSKVNSGGKDWQQITYSGTPTLAGQYDQLQSAINVGVVADYIGKVVQGVGEVEWDANATGVLGTSIGIEGNFAATFFRNYAIDYGGQPMPTEAGSGIIFTEPFVVPATVTGFNMRMANYFIQNQAVSLTLRLRGLGIRKLT